MKLALVLGVALAYTPLAAYPQSNQAQRLAATCANCHGTDGRSVSAELAPLAGRPKDYLVSQMKAFRDGTRPATIMPQLAKGYTDQQIEAIAEYFAGRGPR